VTLRDPDPAPQRSRRKQDLLLASQLARGQAIGAFDELAARADGVAQRVAQARAWLSSPQARTVAVAAGALVLAMALRRVRALRLLRWGWLALGLWRSAAPVLARFGPARRPWHAGR
jgi:hypothetical protein